MSFLEYNRYMSNKIIVANWKMNPESYKEAEVILNTLLKDLKIKKGDDIVICPPFPYLSIFKNKKIKNLHIGAQDVFEEKEGSHTGEVSIKMLMNEKVEYVILGHSEKRKNGENNLIINQKLSLVLKNKLIPILCVGEITRDHAGEYLKFIKVELYECLKDIPKQQIKNIFIAYEPVWAIGKDAKRVATVEEFMEIKIFIKKIISDIYNIKTANEIKIIYGGSVNGDNAKIFLDQGKADGLLVGRDSLNPKKFIEIINSSL